MLKELSPYVNDIISRLKGIKITTRANLMTYALEIFAPKFPTYAGEERKKIIETIKSLSRNHNKLN